MLVFQKRLKETRKDRELTQEELGKAIYVSKQEVCLYESGKRTITISHLITLAKAKNRIVSLSDEDIKIIDALKKDSTLYEKFLMDPDRAITDITNHLKK